MKYSLGFLSPTHRVTGFLIVIIATYLCFALFIRTELGMFCYSALVLDPEKTIYSFQLWRLFTYGFLHDSASPMHLIFNAFLLYMIGPQIEERFGETKFLIFILSSIAAGGVLVVISFLLGLGKASVVGFSAAGMSLIIAWGLIFSRSIIYVFGILPLTGIQLVFVTVGLEILFAASINSISSAAHFGGMAVGFVFALSLYKPENIHKLCRSLKNRHRR